MNRIYITLEGGLIQSVHSDNDNLEVHIIDRDIDDSMEGDEYNMLVRQQSMFDEDFAAGRLTANY